MWPVSLFRPTPIWGYLYKDLLAASSELQKCQKNVHSMMTKLDACSIAGMVPPVLPPPEIGNRMIQHESMPPSVEHHEQTVQSNATVNVIGDFHLSGQHGAERVEEVVLKVVTLAQKYFPDKSMLLLQSKISTLLLRTDAIGASLPLDIQGACKILFPTDLLSGRNCDGFWSNLRRTVSCERGSAVPSAALAKKHVGTLVDEMVCSVASRHDENCSMSLSDIEVLLKIIDDVYPGQCQRNVRGLLYCFDRHGFSAVSILSSLYVHFYHEDVTKNRTPDSVIGISEFVDLLSNVFGESSSDYDVNLSDTGDSPATCLRYKQYSCIHDNVFESNFEYKLVRNNIPQTTLVPITLRPFFAACVKGTLFTY
jgi:hypothetical protein